MTASTITYLIAREHINDLIRDAERRRHVAEVRSPDGVRLSLPRVFTRRVRRAATA